MNPFIFHSPTRYVFGPQAEAETGRYALELGIRSVLIVYGQGSVVRSGLLERVKASFKDSGIAIWELSGIVPNPLSAPVYEGIAFAREMKADAVLGLGGASAMDTAKAIAVGVPYEGDFWDFYSGKASPQQGLKLIVVPTLSASGSEGSNSSVITNDQLTLKRGLRSPFIRPHLAMMNPALTFTVPREQKAYGASDILSHVFERYFTNTRDVALTDALGEALMRQVIRAAPLTLDNPNDYAAHADIMWAGTLAHNDTVGVGREQDWGCHALTNVLSAKFAAPHGAALAVLFPSWMEEQLPHDPTRFAQFAANVMDVPNDFRDPLATGLAGISRLRALFNSWGLPESLKAFGVKEKDLAQFADEAPYNASGTIGFYRPLGRDNVLSIYRRVFT
ncbi:MAG: iron-containing alcohol dehydrogenase [Eubacteriales bacterium]|nr:iron-containing alcohol dehydrogenase [Eubacteriales bacterium]